MSRAPRTGEHSGEARRYSPPPHAPSCAIETPAILAKHSFSYVTPPQPHTGEPSGGHPPWSLTQSMSRPSGPRCNNLSPS